jgi:ribosomal protein L22
MSPREERQASAHSGDAADKDIEAEAKDSAEAVAREEAAEAGEAPAEEKPKRTRRRKAAAQPEADEAEAPAAEQTEVDKEAAQAVTKEPTKPAPRRTRDREVPTGPVVVRAQAKYVRSSARKARLVCDHLRGKPVGEARSILAYSPRAVARDWLKVLDSAIANAEHNHELIGDDLKILAAYADEGPTLKRFRPRAMGRATRIRKRTTHLTITLTPSDQD